MTDILPEGAVSKLIFDSHGGVNSSIRESETMLLGNPLTGEIYVDRDTRDYAGQVYLHEVSGEFPLIDNADTQRDDAPPSTFLGFLPTGVIPAGRVIYNTEVEVRRKRGRWQVVGVTMSGENYGEGAQVYRHEVVERPDVNWGIIRPTDPPSDGIVLAGARYPLGSTWYDIQELKANGLIATYGGSLTLGQGLSLQIERDPTDGSIIYTAGSAFTDTSRDAESGAVDHASVFANYPAGTDATLKHYGWVKLYYNQQVITDQDIYIAPDEGSGAAGGAPVDATYITQTASGGLTNEQALSTLATGAMQVTTSTGVITSLKSNLAASAAPTVNDDSSAGYAVGSVWIDVTADKAYLCLDDTVGAAVWVETTQAGGGSIVSGCEVQGPDTETLVTASGGVTSLDFAVEVYDTSNYVDLGSDAYTVALPSDGMYLITGVVAGTYDGTATAGGRVYLRLNYTPINGYTYAVNAVGLWYVLPGETGSGTPGNQYLLTVNFHGNLDNVSGVGLTIVNDSDVDLFVAECSFTVTRLRDPLS